MSQKVATLGASLALVLVAGFVSLGAALSAGAPDRAAALVPADAAVYASVVVEPSISQGLALRELVAASGAYGSSDEAADAAVTALDAPLAQLGLSAADVTPWLGDRVAGFVLPPPDDGGSFGYAPLPPGGVLPPSPPPGAFGPRDVAVLLATTDPEAALASGRRAAQALAGGAPAVPRDLGGLAAEVAGEAPGVAVAVVDGHLVLGTPAAVEGVARARSGAALGADPAFARLATASAGDALATVYLAPSAGRLLGALPFVTNGVPVDPRAPVAAPLAPLPVPVPTGPGVPVQALPTEDAGADAPSRPAPLPQVDAAPPVTVPPSPLGGAASLITVGVRDTAVVVDVVAELATDSTGALAAVDGGPDLGTLPSGSWAAVGLADTAAVVGQVMGALAPVAAPLQGLGVDLAAEAVWMGAARGAVGGTLAAPTGGVIVGSRDPAATDDAVRRVGEAATQQGRRVTPVQVQGREGVAIGESVGAPVEVLGGADLVVAFGPGGAAGLLTNGPTLGADAGYRRAERTLAGMTPNLYLDLARLRELIRAQGQAGMPGGFDLFSGAPVPEAPTFLAAGVEQRDGLLRTRIAVGVGG